MNDDNATLGSALYALGERIGSLLSTIWEAWSDDHRISLLEIAQVVVAGGRLLVNILGSFAALQAAVEDGFGLVQIEELRAGILAGYDLADDTLEETQERIADKALGVVQSIVVFFDKTDNGID